MSDVDPYWADDEPEGEVTDTATLEDWEKRTRVHGARAPRDPFPEDYDETGAPFTVTRSGYYAARSAA